MSAGGDQDEGAGNLPLRFIAKEFDLLRRVEIDKSAAPQLLRLVADKLRKGEPLGASLAEFIARAFERAAGNGGAYLLQDLGLRAGHRVPKADWTEVAQYMECLPEDPKEEITDGQRATRAAKKFSISRATARNYWNQWRAAKDLAE